MNKRASVSKAKKKKDTVPAHKGKEISSTEINKELENPFDFGGLQISDLKKNLGCG